MSLYTDLMDAKVTVDNHYSDLYALATPEAVATFRKWEQPLRFFRSQIDGQIWLEAPFMFEPYWDAKRRHVVG